MSQTTEAPTTFSYMDPSGSSAQVRPRALGKFLFVGGQKFYVKGVTYGTFGADANGDQYGDPETVERDFALMQANGINSVRTYTVPPCWLLDLAAEYGLYVMVGLPWEQHVAFLDDRRRVRAIVRLVREGVRACAGHPAVLCYAVGNEIPTSLVRWYGPRRVERFIERLYRAAKAEDPEGLVTYVNYPSTEYLDLPFLDFLGFNVYLETQDRLEAYLARLQNLAGDRPLVMTEVGLDSRRNGEEAQASTLDWQVSTAFAEGCAGAIVFSWTDEWHRGGHEVEDWDFGLTTRSRTPKAALDAVRRAFAEVPFPPGTEWPAISVVVCSYNGSRTLRDCCEGLLELDYPRYEVIVVDDGSTDATAGIAEEYGFRVIRTENRGLSSARNNGMKAATGEIVAYIDDDARPDRQWLRYLAATFLKHNYAGVGGPNIPPPGEGAVAACVANSPGGPVHVLLDDRRAEHIPGCNMAFRKECLLAVGGFDPRYRAAGDDVDICWRLQARGWTLGFSPAATVWHHRRASVRAYWLQQVGYGRAEALLERQWPEKYNAAGHLTWAGRLYGPGLTGMLGFSRGRIYGGTWGSAPFQSVYQPASGLSVWSIFVMPEWYLCILALAVLSLLGAFWTPLLLALPLLVLSVAAPTFVAASGAAHANFGDLRGSGSTLPARLLTFVLHLLQPLARLLGRTGAGLTPLRAHGTSGFAWPMPRTLLVWEEKWQSPESWLESVETAMRNAGATVMRGGDYDAWDLQARGGMLGAARLLMGVEEHGEGKQLVRFRIWPRLWRRGVVLALLFGGFSVVGLLTSSPVAAIVLVGASALLVMRMVYESARGMGALREGVLSTPGTHLKAGGRSPRKDLSGPTAYGLLLRYAVPYWRGWLLILLVTLFSTLFALLQPWPLKVLVDNILGKAPLSGAPGQVAALLPGAATPGGLLGWVVAAGLLIYLVTSALDALLTLMWVQVGQRMVYDLGRALFAHIQRRSLLFHSRNSVGDSLSRVTGDTWALHTLADTLLFAPIHAIFTIAALVLVMSRLDGELTLVSVLVAPFMAASALFLGRRVRAASRARRKIESRIQSHVQRILRGILVVQAFTREEHEHRRFREFTRAAIQAQQKSALAGSVYSFISGFIAALGTALVLWLAAHRVFDGRLSVGSVLVFVTYLTLLQQQTRTLVGIFKGVQEAGAGMDRVLEALSSDGDVFSKPGAPALSSVQGHIKLEHVTFGYQPDRPVLHDLSLEIEPGLTVTLVGTTGAGKSTLAGLVARFYDPLEGQVLVDGQDLRDVSLDSLRDNIAIVLQDPLLFPTTIGENIAYGRPGASQADIEAAARAANAHAFIEKLPEGYNTVVGEHGATLSGGEKQRISIARALLKDAPVLILDEPTSALDAETEQSLMEALERLKTGRTTLIISHRLSTIRAADRIAVLKDGSIAEEGTHAELLAMGGVYAHLYTAQPGVEPRTAEEDAA